MLFISLEVGDQEYTNARQIALSRNVTEEMLKDFQKPSDDIRGTNFDSTFYNKLPITGFLFGDF